MSEFKTVVQVSWENARGRLPMEINVPLYLASRLLLFDWSFWRAVWWNCCEMSTTLLAQSRKQSIQVWKKERERERERERKRRGERRIICSVQLVLGESRGFDKCEMKLRQRQETDGGDDGYTIYIYRERERERERGENIVCEFDYVCFVDLRCVSSDKMLSLREFRVLFGLSPEAYDKCDSFPRFIHSRIHT